MDRSRFTGSNSANPGCIIACNPYNCPPYKNVVRLAHGYPENPSMTTQLPSLQQWVDEVAARTLPDQIQWCTGSDDEYQQLIELMTADGTLSELNQDEYPNCYLHLSDPSAVARV